MRSHGCGQERTLRICLIVLGANIFCPVLIANPSQTDDQESRGARAAQIAVDLTTEDALCARCHAKVVRDFVTNPHASREQLAGDSGIGCASCHGSGDAHIQGGGDKSKIFNPTESPATQINDSCLKCHAGKHVVYQRSAHGKSNVSCIRCHSIHSAREPKHLLTNAQPDLCFQCHEDQRSQFSAPFRHEVKGLVLCTDCHEAHGSFGEQLQRSPTQQDIICTKCHTEMAGPFEYEHAIIKTEGCTACHFSHGGSTSHMLNRARVNTICLLCHFPPQVSSTGDSLIEGHDLAASVQLCTDCHADVHGSNVSAAFLKKK